MRAALMTLLTLKTPLTPVPLMTFTGLMMLRSPGALGLWKVRDSPQTAAVRPSAAGPAPRATGMQRCRSAAAEEANKALLGCFYDGLPAAEMVQIAAPRGAGQR